MMTANTAVRGATCFTPWTLTGRTVQLQNDVLNVGIVTSWPGNLTLHLAPVQAIKRAPDDTAWCLHVLPMSKFLAKTLRARRIN